MEARKNTINALESRSNESYLQSAKLGVYELLFALFDYEVRHSGSKSSQKFKFGLINLIQAAHMMGILLEHPPVDDWESYNLIWSVFLFTRIDYLFLKMGYYQTASIVVQGSQVFLLVLWSLLAFFLHREKRPRNILFQIAKVGSAIYVKILPIPTLSFILQLIFYKHSAQQLSPFYIPLGVISLISFLLIYVLYTIGSAEIRHCYRDNKIDSKSSSDPEIANFVIRSSVICYLSFNGSTAYSCYLAIVGETLIAYMNMKGLFYYNTFPTMVKTVCSVTVACIAFAVSTAIKTDDPETCVLLGVFVTPTVIIGVLLKWNFTIVSSEEKVHELTENPYQYSSALEVEKALRPFLCCKFQRELVLNAFSSYFMSSPRNMNMLLVIWETYYCITVLEDELLGKIKLSKRMNTHFSLEGDYQAFYIMKVLKLRGNDHSEELNYLNFRSELEKNKNRDKELCLNYYKFMEELIENEPNTRKVNYLVKQIDESIREVDDAYNALVKKYFNTKEVILLYISFLRDIKNDEQKAIYLEQRHGHELSILTEELNYFDESNAVMIVSGEYSSIGTITYANENICNLLREHDLVGRSLSDFIPQEFRDKHNSYLRRYIYSCTKSEIGLHKSIILCDTFGFLIEVYAKIRCVAVDSYPFFLAFMKPKDKNREIAIMDSNGIITNHTENIPAILKMKSKNIIGFDLEDHIMNNGLCEFGDGHCYYLLNDRKVLYYEQNFYSSTLKMYRFTPVESYNPTSKISYDFRCTSLFEDIKEQKIKKMTTVKGIKFNTKSGTKSFQDSQKHTHNNSIPENESAYNRKQVFLSNLEAAPSMRVLVWSVFSMTFMLISFTMALNAYMVNGFDSDLAFTSLYKTQNLRSVLIEIANDARNFEMINILSKNSSEPFRDMVNYQKDIASLLETCNKQYKVYENEIFYWEGLRLKRINMLDFANKLIRSIDDFFERREMVSSYEFIIRNAQSFPYEFFKLLVEDVEECVDSNLSFYNSMVFLLATAELIIVLINLTILTFAALRVRANAHIHWGYLVDVLSKKQVEIHTDLISRLEVIHSISEAASVFKPFAKKKWSIPEVSIFTYVWRSLSVGVLCVGFTSLFYGYFYTEMAQAIEVRRDSIFYMGEVSVSVQDLDFWTRETMLGTSLNSLLNELNPLKTPDQKLRDVHRNIELLNLSVQKNKKRIFTHSEFDLYYDRSTFEGYLHLAGIYGTFKTVAMDSLYYSVAKSEIVNEYSKFYTRISRLGRLQNRFFLDSTNKSESIVKSHRNNALIINGVFCAIEIVFIIFVFVNFIRADKLIIQHKMAILHIVQAY